MGIIRQKLNNSIFLRVLLIFLFLITPIYLLGLYIHNWGVSKVKEEISNSTTAQVVFYLEQLEAEIERLKILQYDCLTDENLSKLAIRHTIMNRYETVESMRQLQLRLITIANSSMYVKNVSAHILPIGKTISSNRGLDDLDIEKYKQIRTIPGSTGAQIISYQDGLYLSTMKEEEVPGSNNLFMIEIELNPDIFAQAIEQFNTYPDSGSFLIGPNDTQIIAKNNKNNLTPKDLLTDYLDIDNSKMILSKVNEKRYYTIYARSHYLDVVLLRYLPEHLVFTPLQNFTIWVWFFTIIAFLAIVIFSYSIYKTIHKPMAELVNSFRSVENGNLDIAIDTEYPNEFGYLYTRFNEMVKSLRMLIDQVYKQKILMQRAELKHLQSQINPHFLYNSFFIINTMARIGDENLITFTKHLGDYFRFVTRNASDYVTLKEEVAHARTYAEIQAMRFSKRLTINFEDCPKIFEQKHVPRLILQPILENSFDHAVGNAKHDCIICVSFEKQDDMLFIIVEDNGDSITDSKISEMQNMLQADAEQELETTGIINIHRRICLVFDEGSGISISRSALGGLKTTLKLKLQLRKED